MAAFSKKRRCPKKRRPIRLRLTASGGGFFGLIFCTFLMSINFSNNLIFAMTFLLVGIALVGGYQTRMNVSGLTVGPWKSAPVFAGQLAGYRVSVENPSASRRHGLAACASEGLVGEEAYGAAGETFQLKLERQAEQRGRLSSIPTHLRSVFPLGLFSARRRTDSLPEVLVYPAPLGDQPLPDPTVGQDAQLRAESGTFTELRRYAPGDPPSHIHWKALARFDELYTKEFDGAEGLPALWLRWQDVRAEGTEQKLSQLCRWVLDVHSQNRAFGLELPGTTLEPAQDESHRKRCLQALALYGEAEASV